MLTAQSYPVPLLTHTTHLEYTEHARRRTERERAATLVALDQDLSGQKDIWRGCSLHAALLQGERERTQAALAKAVSEEPPRDQEGTGVVSKGWDQSCPATQSRDSRVMKVRGENSPKIRSRFH